MREIDAAGQFWLPDETDDKFDGIMTFTSENGGRIKTLYKRFTKNLAGNNWMFSVNSEHEIIYGFVQGIGDVTLIRCSTYPGMDGYADRINFQYAILGSHFDFDEPKLDNISFSMTHLASWFVGNSSIEGRMTYSDDDNAIPLGTKISGVKQQRLEFAFDNVRIVFTLAPLLNRRLFTGMALELGVRVTMYLHEAVTMPVLFEQYMKPFKSFVEFGTDRTNYFLNVNSRLIPDDPRSSVETLFYEESPNNPLKKRDIQLVQDLVFIFRDIEDQFEVIYADWSLKHEQMRIVIELYLLTIQEQLYQFVSFQLLMQAIEAFHRSKSGKKLAQDKRFNSIIEDDLAEVSDYILNMIDEPSKFINDIVIIRNYLTHLNPKAKPEYDRRVKLPSQFNTYIWKLSNILLACLLLEFGFPAQTVEELLNRNYIRRNSVV